MTSQMTFIIKRVAALYLFDSGFAPYLSHAESFEPVSGTDFFGSQFRPTRGKLYEAGLRYQPPGYNAMLSATVFRQKQKNTTMTDSDPTHVCAGNTLCSVQSGEVKTDGVELEAKTTLQNGLNLTAAYTYTDAINSNADAAYKGKTPTSVAPHTASLWADYTLQQGALAGLGMGAGAHYTGRMWADAANTQTIPSFVLVDAMLRYDLSKLGPSFKGMRFAFNVQNLFDKVYYPGICAKTYCLYGEGRTMTATLGYRF
ncbi:MAG: Ferrichrome outer membrane transporter/phage receptor [Herbaspirillum frisingense]|uniref:Ferrichrome outer membrane transporter/phage receptor n=1 Tax=Herbaspirillum frisingense TaxID=92645 RepID=A0A7V8JU72_9BURK|nr:MAG: Ferrichrome outer membrane transporter/phage receptor [Herbaspirillum frisingense]